MTTAMPAKETTRNDPVAQQHGKSAADGITGLMSFLLSQAVSLNDKVGENWTRKQFGLNLAEWRVLALVACLPDPNVQDIRQKLFYDKGMMSRITKRLVAEGLITSEKSAVNHRVRALRLTEEGQQLYEQMFQVAIERNRIAEDFLRPDEITQLKKLLTKYEAELRKWQDLRKP